ncbi:S1 family peptidase [Aliivibrio kagoshimensis]|uniref:S1 family peptidase n=1 Tax=Aliivibrio kagoshimensis TaxID=2910230 RepID=UPI003D115CB4
MLNRLIMAILLSLFPFLSVSNSVKITPYIVNGTATTNSSYPFMARIISTKLYQSEGKLIFICGATIIGNRHLLTAAHCVDNADEYRHLVIGVGGSSDSDYFSLQRTAVEYVYYPDSYDGRIENGLNDDIAVLKVRKPLPNVNTTLSVLATKSDEIVYRDLNSVSTNAPLYTMLGYGNTHSGQNSNDNLQHVEVKYVPHQECKSYWITLNSQQICTVGEFNQNNQLKGGGCQGDSGGPLLWKNPNTLALKQIGVLSYLSNLCGDPDVIAQSIFTEVSDYRNWITQVINGKVQPKPQQVTTRQSASGGMSAFWLLLLINLLSLKVIKRLSD